MTDFLFKKKLSKEEIYYFLREVFKNNGGEIKVLHIDEFNDINSNVDVDDLHCLCVYSEIFGNASLLIQLYRYSMDENVLLHKIVDAATKLSVACYVPIDDFDGWAFVGESTKPIKGKQIESEDQNVFNFRII